MLTAPDEQVYRERRVAGQCAWKDCPESAEIRWCAKHRAWRGARNEIKVRTTVLVRTAAIELERMGYPVSAS